MLADGGRLARFTDRLNPMLVRCVRQELRSRVFVGTFTLLLIVAVVACLIAAHFAGGAIDDPDATYGGQLFTVLAWGWGFVLVILQAQATQRLVTQERQDDTWDLVDLTGLGPRRIVRGLLLANLTQGLLLTAGIAPFLVLAYLLRGVDLVTIALALIGIPMLGIAASALAVAAACASPVKKGRSGNRFGGAGFFGLFLVVPWLISLMFSLSRGRGSFVTSDLPERILRGDPETLLGLGMLISVWACTVWLLLVLAETLLTHQAGDRSTRPRLAWTAAWLLGLAWAAVGTAHPSLGGGNDGAALVAIGIIGAVMALLGGLFAITEDAGLTPRQGRTFAQAPTWWRPALRFLGPGPSRGRWWLLVFASASLLPVVAAVTLYSAEVEPLYAAGFLIGYGLLLLASGEALARGPLAGMLRTPGTRRLWLVLWSIAWMAVPPLLGLLVSIGGDRSHDNLVLTLASPVTGLMFLVSRDTSDLHLPLARQVLGGLGAMGALWLIWQARRYDPVNRRILAEG